MSPYFGVLPLVFSALKRAFSAPSICTVEAGYLAKLVKEPAAVAYSPVAIAETRDYSENRHHNKSFQSSAQPELYAVAHMVYAQRGLVYNYLCKALTSYHGWAGHANRTPAQA